MDKFELRISDNMLVRPYINDVDILADSYYGTGGIDVSYFLELNEEASLRSGRLLFGMCESCRAAGCNDYYVQIKEIDDREVVLYDCETTKVYHIDAAQYKKAFQSCRRDCDNYMRMGCKEDWDTVRIALLEYISELLEYTQTYDGLNFLEISDDSSVKSIIVKYGKDGIVRNFTVDEWRYGDIFENYIIYNALLDEAHCYMADDDLYPNGYGKCSATEDKISLLKERWLKRIRLFEQVSLREKPDVINLALDLLISEPCMYSCQDMKETLQLALSCRSDNAKIVSMLVPEHVRYEMVLNYCEGNIADWKEIVTAIRKIRGLQNTLLPWLIKNNNLGNYIDKWLSGSLEAEVLGCMSFDLEEMPVRVLISKALSVAMEAHEDQLDKGGNPYIWHPVRVALHCQSDEEKIVALLHDVVEDTSVTISDLAKAGFSENMLDAIQCLTKKDGEEYMDFIQRVSCNKIAAKVKIQDLKDNMDVSRLNGKKPWKLYTYRQAFTYLGIVV